MPDRILNAADGQAVATPAAQDPAVFPTSIFTHAVDHDTRGYASVTFIAEMTNNAAGTLLSATVEFWEDQTDVKWIPVYAESIAGATGLAPQVVYSPTLDITGVSSPVFVVRVPAIGSRMRCTISVAGAPGGTATLKTYVRRD